MKLRLTCLPEEAPRALEQLGAAFEVDEKSREYTNRGGGRRVSLYLDVRPPDPEITREVASQVLWHFGEGGMEPGSFVRELIALISRADPRRRTRLALAEPAYVLAVGLAQNEADGVRLLRAIAAGETAAAQ